MCAHVSPIKYLFTIYLTYLHNIYVDIYYAPHYTPKRCTPRVFSVYISYRGARDCSKLICRAQYSRKTKLTRERNIFLY